MEAIQTSVGSLEQRCRIEKFPEVIMALLGTRSSRDVRFGVNHLVHVSPFAPRKLNGFRRAKDDTNRTISTQSTGCVTLPNAAEFNVEESAQRDFRRVTQLPDKTAESF